MKKFLVLLIIFSLSSVAFPQKVAHNITQINSIQYSDKSFIDDFILFFDCGKTELSDKELRHLDFYAKNIIAKNENIKFYVVGISDSSTGCLIHNKKLCKSRAEYVCDLLDEKYNLGGKIEEVDGYVIDIDIPELSRAVVIFTSPSYFENIIIDGI